jgi:hypothetical protein
MGLWNIIVLLRLHFARPAFHITSTHFPECATTIALVPAAKIQHRKKPHLRNIKLERQTNSADVAINWHYNGIRKVLIE